MNCNVHTIKSSKAGGQDGLNLDQFEQLCWGGQPWNTPPLAKRRLRDSTEIMSSQSPVVIRNSTELFHSLGQESFLNVQLSLLYRDGSRW